MATDRSLTRYQLRILAAVGEGASRALEIATRAGAGLNGVYTGLARLVSRGLLTKGAERPPRYTRTAEGRRQLEASRAYQEKMAS